MIPHPLGQIKRGYHPNFIAPEVQRGSGTCSEPPRKTEITLILKGLGEVDGGVRVNDQQKRVCVCVCVCKSGVGGKTEPVRCVRREIRGETEELAHAVRAALCASESYSEAVRKASSWAPPQSFGVSELGAGPRTLHPAQQLTYRLHFEKDALCLRAATTRL